MAPGFSSMISKGSSFFNTKFPTKNDVDSSQYIFPKVEPAVDGEDCDKACESCTIRYPTRFKIDESDSLYGHVKGWSTHVLVATGKSDWTRDVEDEKGSVMEAFGKGHVKPSNGRLMLSASNMVPPTEYNAAQVGSQPTTVLILPAFLMVDQVRPQDVPQLIHQHINPAPTTTSAIPETDNADKEGAPTEPIPAPITNMKSYPCPHRYLILLCSQKTRDARCGQSAPLLRRELERHLRPLGLYRDLEDFRPGGVGIYFISHVGGHKYSANMMIYRRETSNGAEQAIWLARIRPEDCEGIVKYTLLQGKVIKPERHLRGGFDRNRNLVSW